MGYYLRLYVMCLLLMVPQYAKYMEKVAGKVLSKKVIMILK